MAGKIINGIKYVRLMDSNDLKRQSLEHNIYFTLRDIFWNGEENDSYMATHFNGLLLINPKSYSFGFNKLTFSFARKLHNYLNNFHENRIYFTDEDGEETDEDGEETEGQRVSPVQWPPSDTRRDLPERLHRMNNDYEYILFDEWWENFQALIQSLNAFIIKHEN